MWIFLIPVLSLAIIFIVISKVNEAHELKKLSMIRKKFDKIQKNYDNQFFKADDSGLIHRFDIISQDSDYGELVDCIAKCIRSISLKDNSFMYIYLDFNVPRDIYYCRVILKQKKGILTTVLIPHQWLNHDHKPDMKKFVTVVDSMNKTYSLPNELLNSCFTYDGMIKFKTEILRRLIVCQRKHP